MVEPELETIDEPQTPVNSYSSQPIVEGSPGVEELVNQFAERITELPDNWQELINDDLLESLFSEAPEFDANEEFPLVNFKEIKVSCEVLLAVITFIRSAEVGNSTGQPNPYGYTGRVPMGRGAGHDLVTRDPAIPAKKYFEILCNYMRLYSLSKRKSELSTIKFTGPDLTSKSWVVTLSLSMPIPHVQDGFLPQQPR